MVMTACGERPFSRQTSQKIWNKITYSTKILPTFHYFSSPLVDTLIKNVSEFYLVFKGLPSRGQNQFWRDGLKMWMKASIGFCPQRADLILLTDEVRGRAGFLRSQVEANQGGWWDASSSSHLRNGFKTWVTNLLLELFFNKKYAKELFFCYHYFWQTRLCNCFFLSQKMPSLAISVLLTFHLTNIIWALCECGLDDTPFRQLGLLEHLYTRHPLPPLSISSSP